jgi:hypothetical protein
MSENEAALRLYIETFYGDNEGYVRVALARHPRVEGGKYKTDWIHNQRAYKWPERAENALAEMLAHGCDVYLCPYLLQGRKRDKGTSVAATRTHVHADVDDGHPDCLDRVRALRGGAAIGSGTDGNLHAYVLLTRPVNLAHHEQLSKALSEHLGTKDATKFSDNDCLRAPGTKNFKPTVMNGGGRPPAPVTWQITPDGQRSDPEALAEQLGVELLTEEQLQAEKKAGVRRRGAPGSFADEPTEHVDLSGWHMGEVKAALTTDTGDRSADIMRVVAACVRSRLTLPQARFVVRSRTDLADKLDELTHDDVERCFAKASAACDNSTVGDNGMSSDEGNATMNGLKSGRTISWRTAAQIKDRRPEWAWTHNGGGRLPRSALSLFAARPGVGKSTAARWFAAGFTQGTIEGCFYGHPQNVAYIASEESLEAMVKPSLRAVDADMDRIHFPKVEVEGQQVRLLSVVDEARLTADFIERGITVVIVDPVMSTVGGKADINRNNETREHLEPWARMAEAINGLTLGVVHLVKVPGGDIVAAINGSSAFGEVARAVIAFAHDTQSGDGAGVLSQEKNNAGRIDLALEYGIESATVQTDDLLPAEVGRFVLGGESDRRVSDLLRTNSVQERLGERSREVVDVVRNARTAVTAEVVSTAIEGMSRKDASQYLTRLVKMGFLTRAARGLYEYRRTLGGRLREGEESVVN